MLTNENDKVRQANNSVLKYSEAKQADIANSHVMDYDKAGQADVEMSAAIDYVMNTTNLSVPVSDITFPALMDDDDIRQLDETDISQEKPDYSHPVSTSLPLLFLF